MAARLLFPLLFSVFLTFAAGLDCFEGSSEDALLFRNVNCSPSVKFCFRQVDPKTNSTAVGCCEEGCACKNQACNEDMTNCCCTTNFCNNPWRHERPPLQCFYGSRPGTFTVRNCHTGQNYCWASEEGTDLSRRVTADCVDESYCPAMGCRQVDKARECCCDTNKCIVPMSDPMDVFLRSTTPPLECWVGSGNLMEHFKKKLCGADGDNSKHARYCKLIKAVALRRAECDCKDEEECVCKEEGPVTDAPHPTTCCKGDGCNAIPTQPVDKTPQKVTKPPVAQHGGNTCNDGYSNHLKNLKDKECGSLQEFTQCCITVATPSGVVEFDCDCSATSWLYNENEDLNACICDQQLAPCRTDHKGNRICCCKGRLCNKPWGQEVSQPKPEWPPEQPPPYNVPNKAVKKIEPMLAVIIVSACSLVVFSVQ